MNILGLLDAVSKALRDESALIFAFWAALAYCAVVVVLLTVLFALEALAARAVSKLAHSEAATADRIRGLDVLVRARMRVDGNTIDDPEERPWINQMPRSLRPLLRKHQIPRFLTPARTRTGRAVADLLRAFASRAEGMHQKDGILPSEQFLLQADPGPRFSVNRWLDVLVRVSLLVSFAGLAAVLYSTEELFAGNNSTTDIVTELGGVVSLAASKFFISVFGIAAGLIFLVYSHVCEALLRSLLSRLSDSLDSMLEAQDAQSFAEDPENVLSGAKKAQRDVLKALETNAENIGRIGESFNNDLIGGMEGIQTALAKDLQLFIRELKDNFRALHEGGIVIPIQNSLSTDLFALNERIVQQTDHLASTINVQMDKSRKHDVIMLKAMRRLLSGAPISDEEIRDIVETVSETGIARSDLSAEVESDADEGFEPKPELDRVSCKDKLGPHEASREDKRKGRRHNENDKPKSTDDEE